MLRQVVLAYSIDIAVTQSSLLVVPFGSEMGATSCQKDPGAVCGVER
jgi:hypothetical protein